MVKAHKIFIFSYRQIFPNTCQRFLKIPLLELGLVLEAELGMTVFANEQVWHTSFFKKKIELATDI